MDLVFLSVFASFVSIYFTSACDFDSQCNVGSRCCKRTEGRGILEDGLCVTRATCNGFCIEKDDCLPPEICDPYRTLCTTVCLEDIDCHPRHVCKNRHCVSDDSFIGTTPLVVIGLTVLVACCCCCFKLQRRRMNQLGRNYNTNTNVRNENRRATNVQQNGNGQILEMNSPTEESNDQSYDAIASGGPPSYDEVSDLPDVPPPTYEEAMGASTENLSRTMEERQV